MIQSVVSRKDFTPVVTFPDKDRPGSKQEDRDVRDQRLLSRVTQALGQHALQLSGVVVTADRGCVRLTGHVGSYYLKQLAQERTLAAADVTAIENHLVVESAAP